MLQFFFILYYNDVSWANDARTIVCRSLKMRNNIWSQKGFISMEQIPLATSTRDRMYLCCNQTRRRKGSFARSFSSRFPADKSTFPLSKNVPHSVCVSKRLLTTSVGYLLG